MPIDITNILSEEASMQLSTRADVGRKIPIFSSCAEEDS